MLGVVNDGSMKSVCFSLFLALFFSLDVYGGETVCSEQRALAKTKEHLEVGESPLREFVGEAFEGWVENLRMGARVESWTESGGRDAQRQTAVYYSYELSREGEGHKRYMVGYVTYDHASPDCTIWAVIYPAEVGNASRF